ncbi:TPA: hypothetical protein N0F65_007886 [Lagenidium giganteum]|uniref:Uncharacterized protein n=1 Tax=Lagenidium giganteum TaxID=4803 RepID=A0AAV2Z3A5_9STRA|nr:TPA: hypothetical protein N0F65_007886 [Lagenidium giganteum]
MLDGFVVPHAQFRVFHRNFAAEDAPRCKIDQLSQFCSPQTLEALPTDLHVREFLQLEAQLKALQQQQQLAAGGGAPLGTPSSSPAASATSGTAIVSHRSTATMIAAGAQVECLTFYERLFTLESLVWPDFITTVTTKLTEHFALRYCSCIFVCV